MSSPVTSPKPLELDAVMRSIRPHVRVPEVITPTVAPTASRQIDQPTQAAAEYVQAPVAQATSQTISTTIAQAAPPISAQKKVKKVEYRVSENRVTIDVVPATGEATVGVYLRLPKSVHQQLKTVVFQNELTEQGLQSIADISREAIAMWLEQNRNQAA